MAVSSVSPVAARGATVHLAGTVCLYSGLLGAASGIFLAVVPGQVATDRYSYPLESGGFAAIQVFFFVQHLGLLLGLVGLYRAQVTGPARTGRWGLRVATAGMALLAFMEMAAITALNADYPTSRTDVLDIGYGVASFTIGAGLVVAGVAVVRTRIWRGWQRPLLLVTGIYVFVPMIPALAGPFVAARLAITGWMLLFAALGWALMQVDEA